MQKLTQSSKDLLDLQEHSFSDEKTLQMIRKFCELTCFFNMKILIWCLFTFGMSLKMYINRVRNWKMISEILETKFKLTWGVEELVKDASIRLSGRSLHGRKPAFIGSRTSALIRCWSLFLGMSSNSKHFLKHCCLFFQFLN